MFPGVPGLNVWRALAPVLRPDWADGRRVNSSLSGGDVQLQQRVPEVIATGDAADPDRTLPRQWRETAPLFWNHANLLSASNLHPQAG
jgi:hypothetical protein